MPPVLEINYVEFASPELEASRAFFARAFGWTFTDYGPDYLGVDNAGLDGGIERVATVQPALIVLYTEDLDAADAAVREAGGTITREPYDFPGGRRFHFREPGGTEMAVWSQRVG